ncbi:MAG: type II toxin-antitoxin system VapC family toxin [Granulosicoccaceae bacterium]
MPALDTNVLVRYLVADDRSQYQVAKAFIEDIVHDEALFIPLSVSVELEWVLRSLYELNKSTILTTFNSLLETREIEFHEESSIEITLNLYADSNTDFADCMHIAIAYSNERAPLVTFDRKASRLTDAQLLE